MTTPAHASEADGRDAPHATFVYNVVHRWSERTAIALSLPVAYHCFFLLGFSTYSKRVYIHSLLGSAIYGAFVGKVVIGRSSGFPGWALPVAGAHDLQLARAGTDRYRRADLIT